MKETEIRNILTRILLETGLLFEVLNLSILTFEYNPIF